MGKKRHENKRFVKYKVIMLLVLCAICIAEVGDVEFDANILLTGDEKKVSWTNDSNTITFRASSVQTSDFDYTWPASDEGGGTPLVDIGSNILFWGTPLFIDVSNSRVGIGAFPLSTATKTQVGTEDLSRDASSLVGHWKLNDDAANTTVIDSSTISNNGVASVNTSVLSTVGITNDAFNFNGSSHHVEISDDDAYDFISSFSVAFWAKPDSISANETVFSRDIGGSPFQGYTLFFDNEDKWNFAVFSNNLAGGVESNIAATIGEWQYVVGTRDSDGLMRLYVNAIEQDGKAVRSGSVANTTSVFIGSTRTTSGFYDGLVDNVAIFKTNLSQTSIDTYYNPSDTAEKPILHVTREFTPATSIIELARFERTAEVESGNGIGFSIDTYLENDSGSSVKVGGLQWSLPDDTAGLESLFELTHLTSGGERTVLKTDNWKIGFLAFDDNAYIYLNFTNPGVSTDRTLTIDMGDQDRLIDWTGAAAGANLEIEALSTINQDLTTDASPTFAGLTINGDIDLNNNALIDVGYIDFETGAVAPAHLEGRIFYDDDEKTLSVYNNESDITLQLGQEMYIRATNKTGTTILNGELVYIDGAQGSRPTVALAKADLTTTCQVLAMATHDILDNTTGFVTTRGLVHDVNTNGITAGDTIYLSATTAGAYTNTAPTAPDFIIRVGRCIFENSTTGLIYIDIGPTDVCGTMVIQDLDINTNLDVAGSGTFGSLDAGSSILFDDFLAGGQQIQLSFGGPVSTTRTVTFTIGDSARGIILQGSPTLDDWFDQGVKTTDAPGFATGVTIGNLTLADGSITDSSGTISFNDENLTSSGDLTIDDIIHTGDPDTTIGMLPDNITITVGGIAFITMLESPAPIDRITINDGGMDVDFIVESVNVDPALKVDAGTDTVILTASKIGDGGTTNYQNIDNTGDTWWVGSAGLPFGHMYVDGTQAIIVALTLNTPTEVEDDGTTSAEDGWLAGDLNLVTFPTGGTEHYLTVTKAGMYHVNWNLSFKMVTGAANTQIHAGLAIDSTTFIRDKCEAHRTISNNSDTGNMAGSCIVDLPNGTEELSIWMENTTNSNDAEIVHGSLVITHIGGT